MSDILIRCSSIGKIMTNPRSGGGLSSTTKSYIKDLFLEREYNIRKTFWSRYTDKGIKVEKDSIIMANEVLDWGLSDDYINRPKQEFFKNEFVCGSTDVCTDWLLADVKSSWDGTTFPFFADDKEDKFELPKQYIYQLQGYMWLTGHQTSTLAYCLTDTPEDIVQDEIRRELWKNKIISFSDEEVEEFVRSKHEFSRIPIDKRVRAFEVARDETIIEKITERVIECREYYNELFTKF